MKITGTTDQIKAQLEAWIEFYEQHYDMQDPEIQEEFDICISEYKKQLELLEG